MDTLAVLDKLICQGVIASKKDDAKLINKINLSVIFLSCWNDSKLLVRKNIAGMESDPKSAEANLTENILNPNNLINGIEKYAYPAGVYKKDSRNNGRKWLFISLPVTKIENAL